MIESQAENQKSAEIQPLLDITTNKLTKQFTNKQMDELSAIYRGYYYEFNKAERVKKCGKTEFVYKCGCCGETKVLQFYCELRTCPVCAGKMAYKLYTEFYQVIEKLKLDNKYGNYAGFRHLVLTIPVNHLKTDIKQSLKKIVALKRYFNRKWNYKEIAPGRPGNEAGRRKKYVFIGKRWGAVGGLEIGQKSGMVHYHLLMYCPYIEISEIIKQWGFFAYIRRITSDEYMRDALKNITMYVVNFAEMSRAGNMSMTRIAEIEMSLKGYRRIKTFGIFYNRLRLNVKRKFQCAKCKVDYIIVAIQENGIRYSLFAYAVYVSDYFKYITGAPSCRLP